jgi:hypothetical protein
LNVACATTSICSHRLHRGHPFPFPRGSNQPGQGQSTHAVIGPLICGGNLARPHRESTRRSSWLGPLHRGRPGIQTRGAAPVSPLSETAGPPKDPYPRRRSGDRAAGAREQRRGAFPPEAVRGRGVRAVHGFPGGGAPAGACEPMGLPAGPYSLVMRYDTPAPHGRSNLHQNARDPGRAVKLPGTFSKGGNGFMEVFCRPIIYGETASPRGYLLR